MLYDRVIKESMEHPEQKYLVVVPEQFTMQTQKEIIRLHPRHGIMNIDILSFKRLAYRVFEDLGVRIPVVLDDMGKMCIRDRLHTHGFWLSQRFRSAGRQSVLL